MSFALLQRQCDNGSSSCYYSKTLVCVCCATGFSGCTFPFSATRYTTLPTRHFFDYLFVFFYLVLFWQIYYYMDYELNFMHALYLHLLLQPTVLCSGLVVVAVDVYLLRAHRDSYAVVLMVANGVDDGRCRR